MDVASVDRQRDGDQFVNLIWVFLGEAQRNGRSQPKKVTFFAQGLPFEVIPNPEAPGRIGKKDFGCSSESEERFDDGVGQALVLGILRDESLFSAAVRLTAKDGCTMIVPQQRLWFSLRPLRSQEISVVMLVVKLLCHTALGCGQ